MSSLQLVTSEYQISTVSTISTQYLQQLHFATSPGAGARGALRMRTVRRGWLSRSGSQAEIRTSRWPAPAWVGAAAGLVLVWHRHTDTGKMLHM